MDVLNPQSVPLSSGSAGLITRRAPSSLRLILPFFAAATVLSAVLQRHLLEDAQTAQRLVEFHVGEAFGLAAICAMAFSEPRERLTLLRSDVVILVVAALAWFVPEQHSIYLATTIVGVWLLWRGRSDRQLASIGQIYLALSVHEFWGKFLFKLAYQAIEALEVRLIYEVGRIFVSSLHVNGASLSVRSDWSIIILEGCSSFHNLSLTVLIWLSIIRIASASVSGGAIRALGVSAALVIAINIARILAMLPSQAAFVFWHDGTGSTLVALASVAAAIVPIVLCVERRACRPLLQG
jgi:hypothetical protein